MDSKICKMCKKDVDTRRFYLKKEVCVDCFSRMVYSNDVDVFKNALKETDLPFIREVWDLAKEKPIEDIPRIYIRTLSLPQYVKVIEGGYSESTMISDNFLEEVVLNLKNEISLLNYSIINARKNRDYGTYKNLIQAYERILDIIYRYEKPHPITLQNNIKC